MHRNARGKPPTRKPRTLPAGILCPPAVSLRLFDSAVKTGLGAPKQHADVHPWPTEAVRRWSGLWLAEIQALGGGVGTFEPKSANNGAGTVRIGREASRGVRDCDIGAIAGSGNTAGPVSSVRAESPHSHSSPWSQQSQ
jgi:hypothetical protein